MLTPSIAYMMTGELKRKWKTYYPKKNSATALLLKNNKKLKQPFLMYEAH